MATGQPKRLSDEILNSFIFSLSPVKNTKEELEVYRLRREISKIVNSPKAIKNDIYALAMIEFNLGNYRESIRLLSSLAASSLEFLGILTVAKLTLVHNSRFINQSEKSILDSYFNSHLNKQRNPLEYNVFINSIIGFKNRYFLKSDLCFSITYFSNSQLEWKCGPFSNKEELEPIEENDIPRNISYLFERQLQHQTINKTFLENHEKFLINYLDYDEVKQMISEFSAHDIEIEKDYSKFEKIEI